MIRALRYYYTRVHVNVYNTSNISFCMRYKIDLCILQFSTVFCVNANTNFNSFWSIIFYETHKHSREFIEFRIGYNQSSRIIYILYGIFNFCRINNNLSNYTSNKYYYLILSKTIQISFFIYFFPPKIHFSSKTKIIFILKTIFPVTYSL